MFEKLQITLKNINESILNLNLIDSLILYFVELESVAKKKHFEHSGKDRLLPLTDTILKIYFIGYFVLKMGSFLYKIANLTVLLKQNF